MAQMQVYKQSDIGTIVAHDQGRRPVYLASLDTTNTYVMALADLIFWTDQLREHSKFMEELLPQEDYPEHHERATMFKGVFEMLFQRAKDTPVEENAIKNLSALFVPQAQALVDFKRQLLDEQTSGKVHSFLFPLFLDHIAREGERFISRQKMFMAGQAQWDRDEIINFWGQIMAEHSQFIAHLLEPTEVDLINKALEQNDIFRRVMKEHALEGNVDPVTALANHIIDFKTTALKGIEAAQIKSIITPDLADHVRREAIFFSDELRRADMMMNIQPAAA